MSLKSRQKCFGSLIMLVLLVLLGGVFSPAFAALKDTGQTKCYNDTVEIACPSQCQDFYGQDAQYTGTQPSYTKLDATGNALPFSATQWAMVKDNLTGLIWENKTTDGSVHDSGKLYTWTEAQNVFIPQLNAANFGGHNDWRLPTLEELRSILDYGRNNPATDTGYFPNTQLSNMDFYGYWSSSDIDISAWFLHFDGGYSDAQFKTDSQFVRAVRGSNGAFHNFTNNGNGTVTDTGTGLMWQQATGSNGAAITWKATLAYCENMSLAGYTDWRLPNIRELASLNDTVNGIDRGYFPDTKSAPEYSSSSSVGNLVWAVSFSSDNGTNTYSKSNSYYVRCVRGGITDPSQCTDTNGSTQEGINLVKAKPGDYGLFDQTQLNQKIADAVSTATASMYTKAQLDQSAKTEQLKWDANGDGKIGLEDIIRMLQVLAGLRP